MLALSWILLVVAVYSASGDTPANCTYEDIRGTWMFAVGQGGHNNSIDCSKPFESVENVQITLYFPDVAVDKSGNTGFWTMIYNQGFEVVIGGRKYFAFSYYEGTMKQDCSVTLPGWVHNEDGRNWACYTGKKMMSGPQHGAIHNPAISEEMLDMPYINSKSFVDQINDVQKSWRASESTIFTNQKFRHVLQMTGGRRSGRAFPSTAPVTHKQLKAASQLPASFDWRDVNGVNFVSPIRNQGACGSCYAFGSMAQLEARLRIMSNNSDQTVFSTQNIVSCSQYSQGCDGGFPYLIAGKYGQDFGHIAEDCFPYKGIDMPCMASSCKRHYTRDYYYIGGYYGACNEPLMREELVKNGPIAVSFEVYNDFTAYKSGIYHHTGLTDKFNPWEVTNHVVLVVGYGEEEGQPYWIVKNSWGPEWGEQGFFRIRRGNDECSIESIAVGITLDHL